VNEEDSIEEIIAEYTEHTEEAEKEDAPQKPRRIWRWTSPAKDNAAPAPAIGDTMDLSKVLKKRPAVQEEAQTPPVSGLEDAIDRCESKLRHISSGIGLLMLVCLAGGLMSVLTRFGLGPVAPAGIRVYSAILLAMQLLCAYICNDITCLEKLTKTKKLEKIIEGKISEEIYEKLRGVILDK